MARLVEDLSAAIAGAFESDQYRNRHREIEAELAERQEQALNELGERARGEGIAFIRTPGGFGFGPLNKAQDGIMEPEQVRRYMDNDVIEIAPLAFMRGRTLNNACIIMDEGQNATIAQTKMFLTRMGNNSRVVVTGDLTRPTCPRRSAAGWPTRCIDCGTSRGWRSSTSTRATSSATRSSRGS